jgi:hypothetical protein
MDKPLNSQLNPPLLERFETMPAARPLFRILAAIAAAIFFAVAATFGLDGGLMDAGASAMVGFALATVAVTGHPPFRSRRMNYP